MGEARPTLYKSVMISVKKHVAAGLLTTACALCANAGDSANVVSGKYMPQIFGTIRARYECLTTDYGNSRFEVRNARVGVQGTVAPIVHYKAELDLCDEGKVKMLDAFVRVDAMPRLAITVGQMRVPFTIDAHRTPWSQFFANRSFIAKQVGNVRDVGAMAGLTIPGAVPVTLQGGIFNGSGVSDQKDFWTTHYNFSSKARAVVARNYTVTIGCQRIRPADVSVTMWNVGGFYDNGIWHVEGEYLRKNYAHGAFRGVNAVDVFAVRTFEVRGRVFSGVSALARYDSMSDHSNGIPDAEGRLTVTHAGRHRLTAGTTLHFGKRWRTDVRLNYEKNFFHSGITPATGDGDKIVAELVCHF